MTVLDVLTPGSTAPLAPVTRAEKREAIDRELRANPNRSNRQIAEIVGTDHKTVAARRGEIEIPHEPENSPPNGSTETTAEIAAKYVAQAIGGKCPPPPGIVDEPEFDWNDTESVVLKEQMATAIYFNKHDELVIRQQARWDQEEDSFIYIAKPFQMAFLDRLTDELGIPTLGGPQPPPPTRRG